VCRIQVANQYSPSRIAAAAAQKLKAEAAEKECKATARHEQLLKDAAVEFLRLEFGSKQKPTATTVQEKLQKACKCHLTMAKGLHKERCSPKPQNMQYALQRNVQNRAAIEEQLRLRLRTSLAPAEREKMLLHLFGPKPSAAVSSGASSSSQGWQKRQPDDLQKTLKDPCLK